ncbi:TonB-dependent receptor [Sphingomonas nostoxanthinifaciens]|uniref:TonB-dependent receptor n=1 Tax=Sphingomonas nostoxanthinifaciens TaxID=2872652 RepID=UPI001CC1E9D0|nr:TonB-dependent receptor [Sphingomonas nostoxanthinifaciens]UAK26133.1 TonB-dependent receptor [Sphingomonas nostoxanthinifaciens]
MNVRTSSIRVTLLSAAALGSIVTASAAMAQAGPPAPAQAAKPSDQSNPVASGVSSNDPAASPAGAPVAAPIDARAVQDIVVTGIRRSLASATNAKKASVSFGDSIFAEDIGKLPATNLAETLNRIPGVNINRDIDGEGLQVSIRGLGPSFTKVLLNGTNIAVASDGGTNGGSANREVDLDLFPSELFTRLDVSKTPVASTLEGGIAGVVNLRNARPFDRPGTHVNVIAQADGHDSNSKWGPRGAVIASTTFGDTFGILAGFSGYKQKERIDGFETVGWTDGNLACGTGCNNTAFDGNGFSYASTVPNNTGHGLTPGTPLNLAATSGLSLQQLSLAKIPRLGRDSITIGDRSRISALLSVEWRPSDTLHFAVDGLYDVSKRDYNRFNMNWQVRNSGPGTGPTATGGMVPFNIVTDANNIVTSGTFANSSFFLENDIFNQKTKFWNINPNAEWTPTSKIKVQAQLNYGHSTFFREQPQFDFQTTPQSGVEVAYTNNGGDVPTITPNVNLNDPNLGWKWYRVNVQNISRETTTKGAHLDTTFGDDHANIKAGFAYDDAKRIIKAYDNSTAFQTAVCGATCDGTTGSVPNSQLAQYLMPTTVSDFGHLSGSNFGYSKYIMDNIAALEKATNYAYYSANAPETKGAVTGGSVGNIREKTWAAYVEANAVAKILDRDMHFNFGVRYFHTDQTVASPVQVASGFIQTTINASYDDWLPTVNVSYDVSSKLKLRAAASKTMTRADAGLLLPGTTFSDPSAQVASAGNPNLKPYTSNNIDVGGEYYTGGIGYIGLDLFRKDIDGYTVNTTQNVTFGSLGIPYSALVTTQQAALTNRAANTGVSIDNLPVQLTLPINNGKLLIKGIEATWVQPLDFLIKGIGLRTNATYLHQSSSTGLIAPGVSPWSYNLQGFYEAHGISLSVNYVWTDKSIAINGPQNGINVPLRNDARGQLDLSAGYQLPFMNKAFRLTFDMLNITNSPIRTTFGYDNAPYSVYYPGREYLFGIRASF